MLAMNYLGPYRVRVDDKPMPTMLQPQDAMCASPSHASAAPTCICITAWCQTRIGSTFGHESGGGVEQSGPEVRNLKEGDYVLESFNIACGKCHFCQHDRYLDATKWA